MLHKVGSRIKLKITFKQAEKYKSFILLPTIKIIKLYLVKLQNKCIFVFTILKVGLCHW